MPNFSRRRFIRNAGALSAASMLPGTALAGHHKSFFKISLAQWSLHRTFFSGLIDPVDFAPAAKKLFNLNGIEYVNQFYFDNFGDKLTRDLKNRADSEGVESLLIMVDREGDLGAGDEKARKQTVENHHRWAQMAKELGCHSIRVNARSTGSYDEQMKSAADGLRMLGEYCDDLDLNVLVENHGGLSSDGEWLAGVMKLADHPRVGTLPDFGNFVIDRETGESYDRYKGVKELMPWAKAVSAKAHDFNQKGEEVHTDYMRMMKIVQKAGYKGWVGVEYEGDQLTEVDGIIHTMDLLERVRAKLS